MRKWSEGGGEVGGGGRRKGGLVRWLRSGRFNLSRVRVFGSQVQLAAVISKTNHASINCKIYL